MGTTFDISNFVITLIEWLAVLSGIFYVLFIAKSKQIAWLFAIIGSICGIYLCSVAHYYLETFLQFFYGVMAIAGWILWRKSMSQSITLEKPIMIKDGIKNAPMIQQWRLIHHLLSIGTGSVFSLSLGYYFQKYTNQTLPYLDAFITVFSLITTFMVIYKVLENWIYWIIIDLASIELYAYRGYYAMAGLMALYSVLAMYGYFQWRKQKATQNSHQNQGVRTIWH